MSDKIYDLIYEWELSCKKGRELSLEELTADCPQIRDEFVRELETYKEENDVAASIFEGFKPIVEVESEAFKSPERPSDLGLPDVINKRYEKMTYISSGSFGSVWRAWDNRLNRAVAVKMPSVDIRDSEVRAEEFINEAKMMAGFQHENVVRVYDMGRGDAASSEDGGECPFIVMELMDCSLKKHIKDWVEKPLEAAEIIKTLSDVLVSAHSYKSALIHRDIKPNNILLLKDSTGKLTVKLSDFGLAVNRNTYIKDEDMKLVGAIGFVPPERFQEGKEDVRGDIFSLGAVLYTLLCGNLQLMSTNTHTLNTRRRIDSNYEANFLPLETINPLLSDYPELVAVCKKAMEFEPDDRYNNAKEFSKALETVIKKYDSTSNRKQTSKGTVSVLVILLIVVIVVVVSGITYYLIKNSLMESSQINNTGKAKIEVLEGKKEGAVGVEPDVETETLTPESKPRGNNKIDSAVEEESGNQAVPERLPAVVPPVMHDEPPANDLLILGKNYSNEIKTRAGTQVGQSSVGEVDQKNLEIVSNFKQREYQEPPSFEELDFFRLNGREHKDVGDGKVYERIPLPEKGMNTARSKDEGLLALQVLGDVMKGNSPHADSLFFLVGLFESKNFISEQVALNSAITIFKTSTPPANDVAYILPYIIDAYSRGSEKKKESVRKCLRLIVKKYEPTAEQQKMIDSILNAS